MAPEKAIKLTVNDLIRKLTSDPETGHIKLGWELVAGGTAGGCQVVSIGKIDVMRPHLLRTDFKDLHKSIGNCVCSCLCVHMVAFES